MPIASFTLLLTLSSCQILVLLQNRNNAAQLLPRIASVVLRGLLPAQLDLRLHVDYANVDYVM